MPQTPPPSPSTLRRTTHLNSASGNTLPPVQTTTSPLQASGQDPLHPPVGFTELPRSRLLPSNSNIVALNLAPGPGAIQPYPHMLPRPHHASAVLPPPPRPAPPAIQPLSAFTPTDRQDTCAAATQSAYFATGPDGQLWRLKLNPPGRELNTLYEVLAARVLYLKGFGSESGFVPVTSWITDDLHPGQSPVWIASPMIHDSKDLGPFLVEDGINHAPPENTASYRQALDDYARASAREMVERNRPEIQALLVRYPKGGFEKLTEKEHLALQGLRDASRAMIRAQYKMLKLLPHEFSKQLRSLIYTMEIVKNWDILNHKLCNTVVEKSPDGKLMAKCVDLGVSGLVGFGGKPMNVGQDLASQPARIDDPFAFPPPRANVRSFPSTYPAGNFLPQDMNFSEASPTYGLLGSTPRSAAMAGLMQSIINDESEQAGDNRSFTPPPSEAMEVAWHLAHRPQGHLRHGLRRIFKEGMEHKDPAIRQLFRPEISGVQNADALADLFEDRINAIIARAQRNDGLDRWAAANPERAALIRASAQDGLPFPT